MWRMWSSSRPARYGLSPACMRLCWCSGQTLMVSSRMMVAVSVPSTTAKSFTCFSLLSACYGGHMVFMRLLVMLHLDLSLQ